MLMEALPRLGTPVARLRYEDLVARPRAELPRLLRTLDLPAEEGALRFIGEGSVEVEPNHTVMGNPMRMEPGVIQLRLDDRWIEAMPRGHERLVTALTWPFLVRYGYQP
jgi:hypothetical protein